MKSLRVSLILFPALALSACASLPLGFLHPKAEKENSVSVYRSVASHDGIKSLEPGSPLQFQPLNTSSEKELSLPTFEVDPAERHQAMDGFGAALTESCAINLIKLPPKLQHETLEKIFSKTSGAGFDLLRLPMSATDFSDSKTGNYTYDDTLKGVPDLGFGHFSMERDEKSFSLIREAQAINPDLQILISPWSPPAWMKTNHELGGGGLDYEHYQDLANYFVRVIQEYRKRSINVTMMTIQNEPGYATSDYPSMGMSTDEQIKFISKYLGPTLAQNHSKVRLFAHDHNWDMVNEVNKILDDAPTKKYVSGVTYHCYGGYRWQMLDSMNRHPTIPTLQDECSGTTWSNAPDDFAWWLDNQSIGAVNMGTTGALGWNLCLDEKGGPRNGGCQDCRGMITTDFTNKDPVVTYNPEFYALSQVSRFIRPGSRRLEVKSSAIPKGKTDSDTLEATAFSNPDGDFTFVAQNPTDKEAKFRIVLGARFLTYELPAKSAVTLTWQ
jgi:glucosylceramidase